MFLKFAQMHIKPFVENDLVPSLVTDFDLVLVEIYDANLLKHRQVELSMYEANLLTVICYRWWWGLLLATALDSTWWWLCCYIEVPRCIVVVVVVVGTDSRTKTFLLRDCWDLIWCIWASPLLPKATEADEQLYSTAAGFLTASIPLAYSLLVLSSYCWGFLAPNAVWWCLLYWALNFVSLRPRELTNRLRCYLLSSQSNDIFCMGIAESRAFPSFWDVYNPD